MTRRLEALAIAAHPDDAEIGCGATLAGLARRGHAVGILDLTRGELGSRGTPDLRDQEAAAAAKLLGLTARRNAGLPDGGLDPFDPGQRLAIVRILRELRPKVVFLPWHEVRHPDHGHACRLGEEAIFRAGLFKVETGSEAYRPQRTFYYMEHIPFEPSFVVDVSQDHERRMESVRAYRSQFEHKPDDGEPATFITRPDFMSAIDARARYFGEMAGFHLGEPFKARTPVAVGDPSQLLTDSAEPD